MDKHYWYGLDAHINRMGFGCWQLSGEYFVDSKPQGWGAIEHGEAIRLVHSALDNDIQFFDTASAYGDGTSETILGEAISSSSLKSSAVICTKIALSEEETRGFHLGPEFLDKVEQSLRRLRTDCIDVLLLHNPPDDLRWQDFDSRVLENLKSSGKIRAYGVSSRSIKGAKAVVDKRFGSCLEWVFHLFERRPVESIFPGLQSARMNFIARSPLSRGLLSDRYCIATKAGFDSNHFRSTLPPDWVEWTIDSLRKFKALEMVPAGVSRAALRYCLSFEEVSVVIPGIRMQRHLADAIGAASDGPLNDELLARIHQSTGRHFPNWA